MGQQNKMVVAISGILDSQGLTVSEDFGIQEKNPLVESELLQCQIKVSDTGLHKKDLQLYYTQLNW